MWTSYFSLLNLFQTYCQLRVKYSSVPGRALEIMYNVVKMAPLEVESQGPEAVRSTAGPSHSPPYKTNTPGALLCALGTVPSAAELSAGMPSVPQVCRSHAHPQLALNPLGLLQDHTTEHLLRSS